MAASNTRFTQNSLGQSKTPIDSDHGIYRDPVSAAVFRIFRTRKPNVPQLHNRTVACATALAAVTRSLRRTRSSGVGHSL